MKTRYQSKPLLRNDEQKIVANGDPDLRVNGVLGGPVEGLDVKMLFDPFEKEFNLPPLAVQFCNGERVFDCKVVGQEAVYLCRFKVFIHNEPHRVGILSGRAISGESDCLVGKDSRAFFDRPGLKGIMGHVVFGPGDKISALLTEVLMKLLKRHITLVHQVESASLYRDFVHHFGIVDLAGREQDKGWDGASKIHQCMHLEGAFAVMELCPWAQLQTQFDGAAVERIYHLLKAYPQLFLLVKRGGFLHQSHRKVLIDMPILLLVGLRKRGSGHYLDSRPIEVSAEVKCSLDVSQPRPVGELGKAHHHELVSAIEPDGMPVAFVAVDTLLELIFVKERHDLGEDCFSFVHGLRIAS